MTTEKVKLALPDQRMMELIDRLQDKGIIRYRQEFLDAIGLQKANFRQIRLGIASFTVAQITKACKTYKVDANWVLGFSKSPFQ